jgi:hypothetical protein
VLVLYLAAVERVPTFHLFRWHTEYLSLEDYDQAIEIYQQYLVVPEKPESMV